MENGPGDVNGGRTKDRRSYKKFIFDLESRENASWRGPDDLGLIEPEAESKVRVEQDGKGDGNPEEDKTLHGVRGRGHHNVSVKGEGLLRRGQLTIPKRKKQKSRVELYRGVFLEGSDGINPSGGQNETKRQDKRRKVSLMSTGNLLIPRSPRWGRCVSFKEYIVN